MEQQQCKRKKEKRLSLLYVLGGGILKEDFIIKHTRMIVLVVILTFFFIGNRYTCMQKLREIDRLQQQLRDVRFEALSISSELTGNSRQSQIEMLIEEQGIELEGAKAPPYELYK
ncbi:MAG: FtsL-like putative cell division protein [Tannerellaceae bacterium]